MNQITELQNRLRNLNAEIDYLQDEIDATEYQIKTLRDSGRTDWTCLNCKCDMKKGTHFCATCATKVRGLFEQGFSLEKIAHGRPEIIIFLAHVIGAGKLRTVGGEQ